jgi:hypothetical protein
MSKKFINNRWFNDETCRNVLDFIARIAVFGVGAARPSNVGDDGGVIARS